MLKSPLSALSEYRLPTLGVVLTMAAALWLVAAVAALSLEVRSAGEQWWDSFYPVAYLDVGPESDEFIEFVDELEAWIGVAGVDVETPEEMLQRLEEQFGENEIRQMGVDATMMPTAVVIRPELWRPGQVDLIARVEALEVRPYVVAVDAPRGEALSWMDGGRLVIAGGLVVILAGLLGSMIGLAGLLRRFQERERHTNHLLEIFGAPPKALIRPTILRALAIGAASGAVAGLAFLPWAHALQGLAGQFGAIGSVSPARAVLWSGVIIAGGAISGIIVGLVCSRPRRSKGRDDQTALLLWQREDP